MILSILVYTLTGLSLFGLGWHASVRDAKSRLQGGLGIPFISWEIVLSILLFAIVAGARYNTGFDYAMYHRQYGILRVYGYFTRCDFEPGFILISKCFAALNLHYFFYFAFWGALQIGFVYLGLKDRKFLLPWIGLNIMLGIYFICWMNLIRQYVVVCAFVPMTLLIRQRKWLAYLVCVALLCAIHKSALILVPLYAFGYFTIKVKDGKVPLLILLLCVILGLNPIWLSLFHNISDMLALIGYSKYAALIDNMINGGMQVMSWGPNRISILLIEVVCLWYYSKVKAHFDSDKMLPLYFSLAFVGICLENLLANTNGVVLRVVQFMLVFVLILNAYTLEYFRQTKQWKQLALFSIVLFSYAYVVIFKAVYMPSKVIVPSLYNLFFLN